MKKLFVLLGLACVLSAYEEKTYMEGNTAFCAEQAGIKICLDKNNELITGKIFGLITIKNIIGYYDGHLKKVNHTEL